MSQIEGNVFGFSEEIINEHNGYDTHSADVNAATATLTAPGFVMPFEYAPDEIYPVENIGTVEPKIFYSVVKRLFDIFASLFGLLLMAVPMVIIAIAIKCDSKGKVFYSQERLGLNGKKFMLVKFRSMREDAEKDGAKWSNGDKDDRITKVGRFLRKTRLDELPQLWACLTGTISLIGPRPEREVFYNEFEKQEVFV